MPTDEGTSPLEWVVDLLLHAPLGAVAVAREELPRLIARGREEAEGARFVGKVAVDLGQREAGKFTRRAAERLADLGLVPDPRRTDGPESAPSTEPESSTETGASADAAGTPAAAVAEPLSAPLAIPGYGSLSASQVVQRLDGLSKDELESVRAYEEATRGRKTILSRVVQLQSAS